MDALKDGADRTHAENYVRFAAKLEQMPNSDAFFEEYSELFDSLPATGDVEAYGDGIWHLFQRHQRTVNEALESQLKAHVTQMRRGTLPSNCLLRIVYSGLHNIDSRIKYIERLSELICKSIPAAFQTQVAKNERHVQDIGEAAFIAAQETLQRESPQIPFSTVTTKPDFANVTAGTMPLFVEFKFINIRKRLNSIITEMTSRITIYKRQGAWILFIVYDPIRAITDDDKFKRDFTSEEGVWVGTVR